MRKHNYVVGYAGDGQVAYGVDRAKDANYVDLMTIEEAERAVLTLGSKDAQPTIYKLVPVKPKQ